MQGKIADFGIPDIFQLVSSQGKSGLLSIRGGERETVFLFADGLIVDVQPDRRDPTGMLGKMLVDAGHITPEELKRALLEQEKTGKKLGELLVDKESLTRESLVRYLNLQLKESLFDVLRLKEGDYRFETFTVRASSIMGDPVRPDVLMMEGMQFLDEFPRYREKFPAGEFRVRKKKGVRIDPASLGGEERVVWKSLDFSDEPQRVFRKAYLTNFEGIKGLWALNDRGLIEISTPEVTPGADRRQGIRRELVRRRKVAIFRGALWAVAGIVAAYAFFACLLSAEASALLAVWAGFF